MLTKKLGINTPKSEGHIIIKKNEDFRCISCQHLRHCSNYSNNFFDIGKTLFRQENIKSTILVHTFFTQTRPLMNTWMKKVQQLKNLIRTTACVWVVGKLNKLNS